MSKNDHVSRILSLTLIFLMALSFLPTGLQPSEVQANTGTYPINITQAEADAIAMAAYGSSEKKLPADGHFKVGNRNDYENYRHGGIYSYGICKGNNIKDSDSPWPGANNRNHYFSSARWYYAYELTFNGISQCVFVDTATGEVYGEYTCIYWKWANKDNFTIWNYVTKLKKEELQPLPSNAVRIYGNSRYATANKITDQVKKLNGGKRFSSIIVATGTNYPDALAGAYLAKRKNAPILITSPAEENNVINYIKRNLTSGGTVYILGGTGVVPNSFVGKLNSSGLRYKRLGGSNRYDTNLKILNESGASGSELIVVTGRNFPDALSASAAGRPILLVDNTLTPSQKTFLNKNKFSKITIIGGTGAVSNKVKNELSKYGSTSRVSGSSRYETSAKVAQKYFGSAKTVVLAIGTNYPDALTGGPLALKLNAPMVLTSSLAKDYTYARSYRRSAGISKAYVLGGPTLVSNNAVNQIMNK